MIYPIELAQKTRYCFSIKWSDESETAYTLHQLQKQCPCRNCEINTEKQLDPLVMAETISTVGKYAIKIEFTSGCKQGIYPFEYLLELSKKEERCVYSYQPS